MHKTTTTQVNLNKHYWLLLEISSLRSEAFIMHTYFAQKYHHSKYLARSFNHTANLFEMMQNYCCTKKKPRTA
jgi:hypothetical protein